MNKLISILTLAALMLSTGALAQPDDAPRDRPDRPDRPQHRDQSDRPERGERPGDRPRHSDRERPGDKDNKSNKREPLTVDQVDEALQTLKEMHGNDSPPWMQRIENLAKEDPEAAAKALSRFPRIRDMMHARKNKPEEFKLHTSQSLLMREVFPMVRQLKQAQKHEDQAKVDELKPKIRERIEQLFQIRLQLKEIEIKRIREKLAKAEQELADIQTDSESLIDEKMDEIMTGKGPQGPRDQSDRPERPGRPDRDRPHSERDNSDEAE